MNEHQPQRRVAVPESIVLQWGKRLVENRTMLLQQIESLNQQVMNIELEIKQLEDYCGEADQETTR